MRKLIVTCECGQKLQAPRAALGKAGRCPACSAEFRIGGQNATNLPRGLSGTLPSAQPAGNGHAKLIGEDSNMRFGRAVDLCAAGQFGEAMAILDRLATDYPDNIEIRVAREECARALATKQEPPSDSPGETTPDELDMELIKRVLLEILRGNGADDTKLRAAELAVRILGGQPRDET